MNAVTILSVLCPSCCWYKQFEASKHVAISMNCKAAHESFNSLTSEHIAGCTTFFRDCVVKQAVSTCTGCTCSWCNTDGAATRALMWDMQIESLKPWYWLCVNLKVQCCFFQFQLDKTTGGLFCDTLTIVMYMSYLPLLSSRRKSRSRSLHLHLRKSTQQAVYSCLWQLLMASHKQHVLH